LLVKIVHVSIRLKPVTVNSVYSYSFVYCGSELRNKAIKEEIE
jgi:hypothetical protein